MTGTRAIRKSGQKPAARESGTRAFGVIPQRFSDLSWSDPVSPVSPVDAARAVIEAYLRAAVFVTPRKLASIFRLLFSEAEMNSAIAELVGANEVQATKTCVLFAGIDAQT